MMLADDRGDVGLARVERRFHDDVAGRIERQPDARSTPLAATHLDRYRGDDPTVTAM
jgi:hypothetical protein